MTKRFRYAVVTISTCLLIFLLLGTVLGRTSAAGDENAYRHFAVLTEVLSKIKSEYVEDPDMKSVTLGALNGLLESIDPYASYLSPDQYKAYLKSQEAKKASVGLVLARRFGYVSVVDAIPGSPADKLELATGDIIEAIDGVSTRDMPLAYAEMLLQGEPGSTTELMVIRVRRSAEAVKVALQRENIVLPGVSSKMAAEGVGYLRVPVLEKGRSRDVAAKLGEFTRQGVKKVVLDLRGNSTGPVSEGIALANLFLEKGQIASLAGQKLARQVFEAEPVKAVYKDALVVLTNRGTAGAAEIAAAALLDNKRADVVGERTYGEAAERKALTLEDGSAVIVAVAKYYSPGGKAIPDHAVVPSLLVIDADPPSDLDDEGPAPQPNAPPKPQEDEQLKKAIEVLTHGLEAAKKASRLAQQAAAPDGSDRARPVTPVTPLGVPRPPR